MRYISFLSVVFLILVANEAFAQEPRLTIRNYKKNSNNKKESAYTMAQFIGRWQETERMKIKTWERVEVIDTFYIRFYDENKADTKQGNSVVITGSTELFRDDYITTSANDFKIVSVSADHLLLDDNSGYLHSMSRKSIFDYEIILAPPVIAPDTTKAVIDLSAASLLKDWFAYKRSAQPGFVKSETALMRNLKIREKLSDSSYKGEIEYAQYGKAVVQTCVFYFTGNKLSIIAEDNSWNIEMYKANGEEMIMGKKGELLYYFKNGN